MMVALGPHRCARVERDGRDLVAGFSRRGGGCLISDHDQQHLASGLRHPTRDTRRSLGKVTKRPLVLPLPNALSGRHF